MITIRSATRKDLSPLVDLIREQFEYQKRFGEQRIIASDEALRRSVASRLSRSNVIFLVAEKDQQLVGYAELKIMQRGQLVTNNPIKSFIRRLLRPFIEEPVLISPEKHKVGYIEEIYVRSEMRNRGVAVGYKLYRKAFEWFESQGAREFEGEAWAGNENVIGICRKLGFEPVRILLRKKIEA